MPIWLVGGEAATASHRLLGSIEVCEFLSGEAQKKCGWPQSGQPHCGVILSVDSRKVCSLSGLSDFLRIRFRVAVYGCHDVNPILGLNSLSDFERSRLTSNAPALSKSLQVHQFF